ncbi:MAG: DUF2007 domain-containing protein [Dehalococcoidales bacterium]|nr:MAG: DUF2007 domain-containing protein [Dehalococcoidales bacterium]
MPYCPNCRDEFRDWVEECPDCKVKLVNELPPLPEEFIKEGGLVHVATAPNEIEARLWKGILEEEGILSMIKVAESLNLYLSPLALEHRLYVLEEDEQKALEILDGIVDFEPEYEDE